MQFIASSDLGYCDYICLSLYVTIYELTFCKMMSKKQLELMLNILKRKWLTLQEKEKQLIVQVNNP